nr:MAG TPA: hypothetical protein [Caudoviricetes sp.]
MGIQRSLNRLENMYDYLLSCSEDERGIIKEIIDDLYRYASLLDSSDKDVSYVLRNKIDIILSWDFNSLRPVSRQALSKIMHNIYYMLTGHSDSEAYSIARFIEWADTTNKKLYDDAVSRAPEEFIPTINHMLLIRSLFDSYVSGADSAECRYVLKEEPENEVNEVVIEEKGNEKPMETKKVMLIEVSSEEFNNARNMISETIFDECDIRIYQDLSAIAFHLNRFIPNNDMSELDKAINAISATFMWSFSDLNKQYKNGREGLKKILGAFCSQITINILTSAGLGDDNEIEFYNCVSRNKAQNITDDDIAEYSKFLKMVVASLQYFKQLKASCMSGEARVIYV